MIKIINSLKECNYLLFQLKRCLQGNRCLSGLSYVHNPGSEPLNYATIGECIHSAAQKNPGKLAVKSVYENLELTYEQLINQADALGCALRQQGLQKGDRFGIWSHNNVACIVGVLAAARVGLISVLINPLYEKPELSFCIKKSGIKSLLVGDKISNRNYYSKLQQWIPELQSNKPGYLSSNEFPNLTSIISADHDNLDGSFSFKSLLKDYSGSAYQVSQYSADINPDDGSIIHFTSGTTGDPKAALDSHFGVVNNTYLTGKWSSFHEGEQRICLQTPIFHALGSVVTMLSGLQHSCSLILPSATYNLDANVNALYEERCTAITGTPTMFLDILGKVKERGEAPSNMKLAMVAGAPCSPKHIMDIKKYMQVDHVMALYGMTEVTACAFQSRPGDTVELVAETVGHIHEHTEAKVVDEEGRLVPFGTPGELLIRGYQVMKYYWDEPEKTKKTIDENGWISTGDKFVLTENGYGRIVGRLKDLVVRGGENIAPKEIEDFLNTHPDIIESQIVGVPDERLGEELCAVLRVRKDVNIEDIRRHCSGHLAKFKIPRFLKIVDDFPKTNSGKVQKFRIKEWIENGKI